MIVHDNNKDDGKIFLILVHVCNLLTVECGYTQNIGNLSIHSAWLLLVTDGGGRLTYLTLSGTWSHTLAGHLTNIEIDELFQVDALVHIVICTDSIKFLSPPASTNK